MNSSLPSLLLLPLPRPLKAETDDQQPCERTASETLFVYSSNPPGFAFVLYKYGDDADSAVRSEFRFGWHRRFLIGVALLFQTWTDGRSTK